MEWSLWTFSLHSGNWCLFNVLGGSRVFWGSQTQKSMPYSSEYSGVKCFI